MGIDPISGTFTVKSNEDGDWYEVSFKPDREQTWSAEPRGWSVKFSGVDRLNEVKDLVGADKCVQLRDARLHRFTPFGGHVSRDRYWKHATTTNNVSRR